MPAQYCSFWFPLYEEVGLGCTPKSETANERYSGMSHKQALLLMPQTAGAGEGERGSHCIGQA